MDYDYDGRIRDTDGSARRGVRGRRRDACHAWFLVLVGALAASSPVRAQVCGLDQFQKLMPVSPVQYNPFGVSLSIDGTRIAVGRWVSATVFRFDDSGTPADPSDDFWTRETELWTSAPLDGFGTSVSISGDRLVVGAHHQDFGCAEDPSCQSSGAVFVYRRDDNGTPLDVTDDVWVEEERLQASDARAYANFGISASFDNHWAIFGASSDNTAGTHTGSAYVFRLDDNGTPETPSDDYWVEQTKLIASDAGEGDYFGYSVSLSGDLAVVGAYSDDHAEMDAGSAYVFRREDGGTPSDPSDDTWVEETKLTAEDAAADDWFGLSVDVEGERIVVGASDHDQLGEDSGAAYVFWRKNAGNPAHAWEQEAKLVASDGAEGDGFGISVSIAGDRVLVGANGDDDLGGHSGSAYLFRHSDNGTPQNPNDDAWLEVGKLRAAGGSSGDSFGFAVTLEPDRAVITALGDDEACSPGWLGSAGAAYVFTTGVDCNDNGAMDGCEVLDGTSVDCDGNGVPDECDLAEGRNDDCNENGVLDSCDIADGTSVDCNHNRIPDWCDLADGTSADCNTNNIPDSCDLVDDTSPDCNTNRVPDECDLADGTSVDCNGNSIPDSCDLASATSEDCNGNEIPDDCLHLETDCDGNAVPDDCELNELDKITAGDADRSDYFGSSVAMSGDRLVVGTPGADDACPEPDDGSCYSGAAYVYRRSDNGTPTDSTDDVWVEEAKLTASDTARHDVFGRPVSIDGDRIVVSAVGNDHEGVNTGAAYVFRREDNDTPLIPDDDFWVEEDKLVGEEVGSADQFGSSVFIKSDSVIVGAIGDDEGAFDSGAAYIFRRHDNGTPGDPADDYWVEEARLKASDPDSEDAFGNAVSIDGDHAVVGVAEDDVFGSDSGSVYVFRRDDNNTPLISGDDFWVEETRLTALDAAHHDLFGGSVCLSGTRVVIGAEGDRDAGVYSGSAYVFRRSDNGTPSDPVDDSWIQEQKLTASDATEIDLFGGSVFMTGDRIAVGASLADGPCPAGPDCRTGAVYLFRRHDNGTPVDPADDFWVEEERIVPSDADEEDSFGCSVSISGDLAAVGAYRDDGVRPGGTYDSGSAYVFAFRVDCNKNGVPDECDIGDGTTPDCNGNGYPDECDIAWQLSRDVFPPNGVPDECEFAGDCDDDWDVDLDDFAFGAGCLATGGPDVDMAPGCGCVDLEGDHDVDLRDFAILQRRPFGGP